MTNRFDRDEVYALEGHQLQKLEGVSQRLNDMRPLTWDDRRDLANRIDLILSDAANSQVSIDGG
jgi:hypothetical protein